MQDTLFGEGGESNSEEMAKSFETALRGVQSSSSRWKSMVATWIRELSALGPATVLPPIIVLCVASAATIAVGAAGVRRLEA